MKGFDSFATTGTGASAATTVYEARVAVVAADRSLRDGALGALLTPTT